MNVNIWLILTQTAVNTLRDLMDDESYDGQHIKAVRIFREMADYVTVEKLFKRPTIGGKKRFLFSVNLQGSSKAKDAIDYLLATYPGDIAVGGAYRWDNGLQVGLSYDENGDVTGTPIYPQHPKLIKFMPTIKEYNVSGVLISETDATQVTDVNLIQGQHERVFG